MPKAFRDKGQAPATEIWDRVERDATLAFAKERATFAADTADEDRDREHLLGMVETLQADNAALKARAGAASRPVSRSPRTNSTASVPRSSWTASCRRSSGIPVGGAMTPTGILPELRPWTIRGATLHKEPLTPATLRKKMDVRVFHGRYFEPRDDGRYARKAG